MNDFRFAVRQLLKNPAFTVVAVFTLALGIMATTAMYSVVHAVLLDPFPYKDVDNLMSVKVWQPGERGYRISYTTDQFIDIAAQSTIFEGVIASTISDVLWTSDGDPQRLRGNYGTPNTFQVMGVPPLLGRFYVPSDGAPDAAPVVVLGYKFWQRQFGGDPAVIGRELRLNDKVRTVVGVMPKRFMWRGADVYLPVVFQRGQPVEGLRWVHLLGRLKPGVTKAQAATDLHPIIEELVKKEPNQFPEKWRVELLSFKETFPSDIRESLWILFGAVGLLLLIACANVSNLLLSKAGARQKEMAVRSSLGASRVRLVRQLLTESLVLSALGGILGIALAYEALQAILVLVPPNTIPDESEIKLNTQVLLFSLLVSALTSILFGLAPALHTCTRELSLSLREAGRGLAGSVRQAFLRKGLVIAEVALSLLLLVSASLMIRTYLELQEVKLGFRADRLLTMRVPLAETRYANPARRTAFFSQLQERVKALPGVVAVGLNTSIHPMRGWTTEIEVIGSPRQDSKPVAFHQINGDYPKSLGIALMQGRLFDEVEVANKRQLAVVNQTFVRTRLDDRDPLGRVIRLPFLKKAPFDFEDNSFQIVGVVRDTLNRDITQQVMPEIYFPYTVLGMADRLVALTEHDPSPMTRAVLSQVYALDRDQPVTEVKTIQRALQEGSYAGPRFNLTLFAVFAALGLTLAVIGIYGVMSNTVTQQTHEIGVRLAIGATPSDVAAMVLKRGWKLLLIGVAVGLLCSLLATRLLARQIWNVSPFDPMSFAVVSLILLVTGLLACAWPARRAARIQPVEALRYE